MPVASPRKAPRVSSGGLNLIKSWYTEEHITGLLQQREAGVKTADLLRALAAGSAAAFSWPPEPKKRCGTQTPSASSPLNRDIVASPSLEIPEPRSTHAKVSPRILRSSRKVA
jgi:hypothetical protein